MRESNYGKRPPMSKRTKKMLAGMIGAGVMVAVIVFFSYYKVDTVEVRGTSHYTVTFILTEMAFLWRVLRTEMRRFRILTEFR